jgi:CelD/BcsL family acetyltransferase involved in cellulose biosynthesis
MPRLLADGLAKRKAVVHARSAENTWRIALPDSWDAYLAELSKSHRKQLRQLERRVFDAGTAELHTVDRADNLTEGWEILTQLHQRRLRSLGKPGCFDSKTFSEFHRAASEALYRAGRLRLHWLELAGKPIAAEYHLVGDGVLFAYQGGIDPRALRREPGRLIMMATLGRAIATGYRAFDFCRGDELYKAHWRAVPCENLQWRIVSNRSSARLRQSVWKVRHSARDWVKRSLHAARRFTL